MDEKIVATNISWIYIDVDREYRDWWDTSIKD